VIRRRLRIFEEATAPLLAYYRDEGLARVVDATRSPDEITEVILALAAADAP
jgi:adenylate kinase